MSIYRGLLTRSPQPTGAPYRWDFELLSFARSLITHDSLITQPTSRPYNSKCPTVRITPNCTWVVGPLTNHPNPIQINITKYTL